jgi:hypothetical protein
MKKAMSLPLLLALCMSASAMAQEQGGAKGQEPHRKAVTILGQVSDDGKALVSSEDDVWEVSNPRVLHGREGQQVIIKCQVYPDRNEIRVLSVKMAEGEVKYVSSKGDSAFRR